MRGLTQSMYAATLRIQAVAGLGVVGWLFSEVPGAISREQYVGLPLSLAVIAGVIGIATLWPFLTPSWFDRPSRGAQAVPLALAHFILPLLYAFVAMNAVVAAQLPQAIAQPLGLGIVLGLLIASGICFSLGVALCFWNGKSRSTADDADDAVRDILHELPPNRVSPELDLARPRQPEENAIDQSGAEPDFGTLRRARMQRAS